MLYSQFSILELPKTTGGKTHIKADLEVLDILKVGIKGLSMLQTMNLCYVEFNFQASFYGELVIDCSMFTNVYMHNEVEVDNCFYTVSVVY